MKKIFLILMTIVAVTSASCKKDNSKSISAKIAGKWIVKSVISHQTYQGVTQHDTVVNTNNYDSYEFKADGTTFIKESDTEQNIGWKINNNKLVLGVTTAYGEAQIFDINTLTNTTLQIHRFSSTTDWTMDQTINLSKEDS